MNNDYQCKNIYLEITGLCNLKCRYCFNSSGKNYLEELNEGKIIKLLEEAKGLGVKTVELSGGEPLVKPGWENIMEKCHALDLKAIVFTNGTLIDDRIAGFLASVNADISLSLDAADEIIHNKNRMDDSFRKVVKGIKCLTAAGLGAKMKIKMVVTSYNYGQVGNYIRFAHEQGIKKVGFILIKNQGRAYGNLHTANQLTFDMMKRMLEDKNRIKKQYPGVEVGNFIFEGGKCGILRTPCLFSPRIAPDGSVFLCAGFTDQQFSVGNIREGGLDKALRGEQCARLVSQVRDREQKMQQCKTCRWKNLKCDGGCPAGAFKFNGNLFDADPLCSSKQYAYTREFLELVHH